MFVRVYPRLSVSYLMAFDRFARQLHSRRRTRRQEFHISAHHDEFKPLLDPQRCQLGRAGVDTGNLARIAACLHDAFQPPHMVLALQCLARMKGHREREVSGANHAAVNARNRHDRLGVLGGLHALDLHGDEQFLANAVRVIIAICSGPAIPMARVAFNNYTLMGQLLDAGVLGIVVPLVDTVEQAQAVAAACRYPPVGQRSYGWGRALAYGDDYADCVGEELFVAVQIESVQAAENAEAIMAVPGIDGCMVGPADLSLSMGFHPREALKRENHVRWLERIVQACRNTGKIPGIDTGAPELAALRVEQGFKFIVMGTDVKFLTAGAAAGVQLARKAVEGHQLGHG